MTMEQKNELIKKYLIDLSTKMNSQYKGIMPEEKIEQAIMMFYNSEKSYEVIIEEINKLAEQTINYYIMQLNQKQEFERNQELQDQQKGRNCQTFEQIKSTQEKVQRILEKQGLKIYTSGGSVPYLLLNQDSNRLHDDIDNVCRLEDMNQLREVFNQLGLYDPNWDSMNFANDGVDYGFEMRIDGVPFGIYPFSYENGQLTQYTYDPYNKLCKINTFPLQELSDYVMTYQSVDGKSYDTMSLEYIKLSKDNVGRKKDIIDSKKITETGLLRPEILKRIQMYTQVQNIEAEKLENKNSVQMS